MRKAFTMVELLVVLAVIMVLVALLFPAVQAAREAARKVRCSNNLKQVSLAILTHVSGRERLPALLNPAYMNEPGHWVSFRHTVLPYLEQQPLYDALADPEGWEWVLTQRSGQPVKPVSVPTYLCPSSPGSPAFLPRRQIGSGDRIIFDAVGTHDNVVPYRVQRNDVSVVDEHGDGAWFGVARVSRLRVRGEVEARWRGARLQWITDGLSKTILVAEQGGSPRRYKWMRLSDPSSDGTREDKWVCGAEESQFGMGPLINYTNSSIFSFHPGGAHVVLCDGAVCFLHQDISRSALSALLIRNDGLPVDMQAVQTNNTGGP